MKILLGVLLCWPFIARTTPDDWATLFTMPDGLRWDNLEGGAEWLSGPRPVRDKHGLHWIEIPPYSLAGAGDVVSIRITGGAFLHILPEQGQRLDTAALEIEMSNGTGLLMAVQPTATADGGLLLPSFSSEDSLVRLRPWIAPSVCVSPCSLPGG